ncbi:hypothetical protein HS7_15360 [Sulfolobales archaeon HS-7]|nr:hypothetical protein HS7_15360 [Sulfolobales archaeon HS-7]
MKLIIAYDDGRTQELEPKKVEIISSREGNIAHYKIATRGEITIIFHAFVPTTEMVTLTPKLPDLKIEEKIDSSRKYQMSANEMINAAKSRIRGSPEYNCVYCGEPASNSYQGKRVCSECFSQLSSKGESEEFLRYVNRKLMRKLVGNQQR